MIDPLSRYLLRSADRHGPVMLMYHSIARNTGTPTWPWAISPERFREQLDFLSHAGYRTATVAELVASPRSHDGHTAVITFDDGYVDNLQAWDDLKKRAMRATWFIVSGSVGCEPSWPADGRPAGRLLSAEELRAMNASGMEIASHAANHIKLPTVDDRTLKAELANSKSVLEDILGREITSFAYPYGAWDERCEAAVKNAGYYAACTTRTGWSLRDNDPFRLRRLTIFNTDTASTFARKLALAANDVSWLSLAGYAGRRLQDKITARQTI